MTKTNTAVPEITTRATRSLDAKITIGILSVEFNKGKIKMIIHGNDRAENKDKVAELERIIHDHIGMKITEANVSNLADLLTPIAIRLKTLT